MEKKFDFSGWATKANLLCSDGRIIRQNAFEECDGITVPLVWNHQHNKPDEVLGHALLEKMAFMLTVRLTIVMPLKMLNYLFSTAM